MRRAEEEKCSTRLTLRTVGGSQESSRTGRSQGSEFERVEGTGMSPPPELLYSRPNPMLRLLFSLFLLTASASPQITNNEYAARRLRAMDIFKDGLLLVQA